MDARANTADDPSSFVRSLLRAGVQPTLDPSTKTLMSVQCMCELCRVKEGLSRREQLVRYF